MGGGRRAVGVRGWCWLSGRKFSSLTRVFCGVKLNKYGNMRQAMVRPLKINPHNPSYFVGEVWYHNMVKLITSCSSLVIAPIPNTQCNIVQPPSKSINASTDTSSVSSFMRLHTDLRH